MSSVKMIAVGLVIWPAAEIATFIIVAALVGTPTALALLILISACGFVVLRRLGTRAVARLRASAPGRRVNGMTLDGAGAAAGLGGILMVIPGFITGILGFVMIVPASRQWALMVSKRFFSAGQRTTDRQIIELAPQEWQHLPDPQLPHRRRQPAP